MNPPRLEEPTPPPARDLGGWIILAVSVSILLHFVLLAAFGKVQWTGKRSWEEPTELPFRVENVIIDKALLDPGFEEEEDAAPKFVDDPRTEVDILEIADAVAERELAMTPMVDVPSNLTLSKTPELAGAGPDLSADLAHDVDLPSPLASELDTQFVAMEEMILNTMPAMSESQAVIDLKVGEENLADLDAALKEELAKASADGSGDETVEGFARLDDLLNYDGPILDSDKPILMPTDLLFGYDSTELQDSARLSMMKLGILIQKNPEALFIIEGHTDTTGDATYNQTLSERRAEAVKRWLRQSLKIESERILTVGYGETRPIADPNGSIEEQALNRRVEINFRPRGDEAEPPPSEQEDSELDEGEPPAQRALPVGEDGDL